MLCFAIFPITHIVFIQIKSLSVNRWSWRFLFSLFTFNVVIGLEHIVYSHSALNLGQFCFHSSLRLYWLLSSSKHTSSTLYNFPISCWETGKAIETIMLTIEQIVFYTNRCFFSLELPSTIQEKWFPFVWDKIWFEQKFDGIFNMPT